MADDNRNGIHQDALRPVNRDLLQALLEESRFRDAPPFSSPDPPLPAPDTNLMARLPRLNMEMDNIERRIRDLKEGLRLARPTRTNPTMPFSTTRAMDNEIRAAYEKSLAMFLLKIAISRVHCRVVWMETHFVPTRVDPYLFRPSPGTDRVADLQELNMDVIDLERLLNQVLNAATVIGESSRDLAPRSTHAERSTGFGHLDASGDEDESRIRDVAQDLMETLDLNVPTGGIAEIPRPATSAIRTAEMRVLRESPVEPEIGRRSIHNQTRPTRNLNEAVNATTFLQDLPVIPQTDLSHGAECTICREQYATGCHQDVVHLPCGHLFGRECIATWLSPDVRPRANTCPMCRAVLFNIHRQHEHDFDGGNFDFIEPGIPLRTGFVVAETPQQPPPRQREARIERVTNETRTGSVVADHRPDENTQRLMTARALRSQIEAVEGIVAEAIRFGPRQPIEIVQTARGLRDANARGMNVQPHRVRSLSEQVLLLFRYFVGMCGASGRVDQGVAGDLAELMGTLYCFLQDTMRARGCPIIWMEHGPPLSFLIDPAIIPLVEVALERLVQIERDQRQRAQT